jgi:hypothetical protein
VSFPTLDDYEYPVGSQKRQEKEAELERLNLPAPVPESEWAKENPENAGQTEEA